MKTLSYTITLLLFILFSASSINIPLCKNSLVSLKFKDTQGKLDSTTTANLCHDTTFLYVSWQNVDSEIISTYTKCNDPLYKQDAVQIFIASPKSFQQNKYYEFEVSPKGVLFFSDITNPSGNCSKFSGELQNCAEAQYSSKIIKNGWQATLKVNLQIIGRKQKIDYLLMNLFRIDVTSGKATRYLAFNPTMTPSPCFHVPSKFEKFYLSN